MKKFKNKETEIILNIINGDYSVDFEITFEGFTIKCDDYDSIDIYAVNSIFNSSYYIGRANRNSLDDFISQAKNYEE